MDQRFDGQVAVVTGAAGGIGRAAAQRFAADGAKVVLVDLAGTELAESAAAVELAGSEARTVEADVTRAADVARYVQSALDAYGRIDHFFNNAGILGPVSTLFDYPEEDFDRVLQVNVKGVWLGLREVGAAMRERRHGTIVNTASIAGLQGTPALFAYGASKHAVVGMTKSAAIELGPSVRVNAVCPAVIDTPMGDELARGINPDNPDAVREFFNADTPLARMGTADEIAGLVTYLCSEDASFITGGIYPIDGGTRAR